MGNFIFKTRSAHSPIFRGERFTTKDLGHNVEDYDFHYAKPAKRRETLHSRSTS